MVFLMETKVLEDRIEKIGKCLNFQENYYVNPRGKSGGLALWWNRQVVVNISSSNHFLIDAQIVMNHNRSSFRISFIWAIATYSVRYNF